MRNKAGLAPTAALCFSRSCLQQGLRGSDEEMYPGHQRWGSWGDTEKQSVGLLITNYAGSFAGCGPTGGRAGSLRG